MKTIIDKPYFVYILLCDNGNYYTGYTDDLKKRLKMHHGGACGAKYTKSFKPLAIAAAWKIIGGRGAALKIEYFIKKQTRAVKIQFIENPELLAAVYFKKNAADKDSRNKKRRPPVKTEPAALDDVIVINCCVIS